jgi:predicted nucleic acid-binding protein
LDDRAGRRAAQALGLRVFGTLSLVALAAQQGHVASFDDAVAKLRSAGLYASDSVVEAVRWGLQSGQ